MSNPGPQCRTFGIATAIALAVSLLVVAPVEAELRPEQEQHVPEVATGTLLPS